MKDEGSVSYLVEGFDGTDSVAWSGTFESRPYPLLIPDEFHTCGDFVLMTAHQQSHTSESDSGWVFVWTSVGESVKAFRVGGRGELMTAVDNRNQVWIIRQAPRSKSVPRSYRYLYNVYGASGHLREGIVELRDDNDTDQINSTYVKSVSVLPGGNWLCLYIDNPSEDVEQQAVSAFVLDPDDSRISNLSRQELIEMSSGCAPVEMSDIGFKSGGFLQLDADSLGIDILLFPNRNVDTRSGDLKIRERMMCLHRYTAEGVPVNFGAAGISKSLARSNTILKPIRRIISQGQSDRNSIRTLLIDKSGAFEERVSYPEHYKF